MILAIAEQRNGVLNAATWEAIAAAQEIAKDGSGPVKVVVAGATLKAITAELSAADVAEVLVVEDEALQPYTPDGFVIALSQVVAEESPDFVVFPHTYQTRDYAPKLATRVRRTLVTDCIGIKQTLDGRVFVRPMFQGKFVADVTVQGPTPHFVSVQVGAYRAEAVAQSKSSAPTRNVDVIVDSSSIRQRPSTPYQEARQAVDLAQADRIVAVGRGIKEQEHMPLIQELAKALDAELAASRPICDAGWLPMDRQIGSSGQTVAPSLYVALGISGAIQHLVGMKGARTIVAINKDVEAPIFEVADYGIVGDLFDIVPALISTLKE